MILQIMAPQAARFGNASGAGQATVNQALVLAPQILDVARLASHSTLRFALGQAVVGIRPRSG